METIENKQKLQWERERDLGKINIELAERNHEALKQYNADRQRLCKELDGIQSDYHAEKELLLSELDQQVATRNHLRRQGLAEYSIEIQDTYMKERYSQRNLSDLKSNYRYDCDRIRETIRAKHDAYVSLCIINKKWAEQRKSEVMAELTAVEE